MDYVPVRPYLYYTLDVTYHIEDASLVRGRTTIFCRRIIDHLRVLRRLPGRLQALLLRPAGGHAFGYIPKPADLSYELSDEYDDHTPDESERRRRETFGDRRIDAARTDRRSGSSVYSWSPSLRL